MCVYARIRVCMYVCGVTIIRVVEGWEVDGYEGVDFYDFYNIFLVRGK